VWAKLLSNTIEFWEDHRLAQIQKQFEQFHDNIKLGYYDECAELREKRDRVIMALSEGLDRLEKEREVKYPGYSTFNQGSYAMHTGIKPLDSDYDIDVGVLFRLSKDDYDPVEVKEWVYDALDGHTERIELRRSCVTVYYQLEGEPIYHVDLAIYSDGGWNSDKTTYIAKGKRYSDEENRFWEEADPQGLITAISEYSTDAHDRKQFRRIVRYLKRWKDHKFSADGNEAPVGIALTTAAYDWLSPTYDICDPFSGKRQYDDLRALIDLVDVMLSKFEYCYANDEWTYRLKVNLPVVPQNDLLEKMSNKQMANFKDRLEDLGNALENAQEEPDPVEACRILTQEFGDDFPVPDKKDTAFSVPPGIVGSSCSA
jgi:hypothetical protein